MSRLALPVGPSDPILGPATALLTLMEYGDYECPFCGQAHAVVSEVRVSPLLAHHGPSSRAAGGAGGRGRGAPERFWEMHDMLFEHQDALEDTALAVYASALGLDRVRFLRELAAHVHAPRRGLRPGHQCLRPSRPPSRGSRARARNARVNGSGDDTARRAEAVGLVGRLRRALEEEQQRALAVGFSDRPFYDGAAATHRLFTAALREAGAEPVEGLGRPFDPSVHEAVATVPADGAPPGTVVREMRRGWRLGGERVRPAHVVAAAAEESARPWP